MQPIIATSLGSRHGGSWVDRINLAIILFSVFLVIILVTIVYGIYNQKEESNTIRIYANQEWWTCTIVRNDPYDSCVSDSGKKGYVGELI